MKKDYKELKDWISFLALLLLIAGFAFSLVVKPDWTFEFAAACIIVAVFLAIVSVIWSICSFILKRFERNKS